jgi:hypothetical protein
MVISKGDTTMMNMTDYTNANLRDSLDLCPWSVRDEAAKRHNALAKKIAAAKAKIAKMQAEADALGATFEAALAEIARA